MKLALWIILVFWGSAACAEATPQEKLAPVKHIIIFYLENHSFDNLFGTFPGANGLANAGAKAVQTDRTGTPFEFLPPVMKGKEVDTRFPEKLPNKPFLISDYVHYGEKTGDLVHRFYQIQAQMHDGKMDRYSALSNAGGLTQGYYEEKESPLWQYAQNYTLADNAFTGVFGGSFVNHVFLICGCVPRYENAPKDMYAVVDDREFNPLIPPIRGKNMRLARNGILEEGFKDGALTPDGYAVNTIQPFHPPYKADATDPAKRLPPLTLPTIGDRLSEKNIDWAWYNGGWNDARQGKMAEDYDQGMIVHHHPFLYFSAYAPGTRGRELHLKDEADLLEAINTNSLPAVAFYKPVGEFDLHPGYAKLQNSQDYVFDIIKKIENSPAWKDSLIIVAFDDTGGWYDHVMPPSIDRFGPGARVPLLVISPFAKRGFIDSTFYDTASILKLIETKFDLEPLGEREAKTGDLTGSLQ